MSKSILTAIWNLSLEVEIVTSMGNYSLVLIFHMQRCLVKMEASELIDLGINQTLSLITD